jgi:hypothetical protein
MQYCDVVIHPNADIFGCEEILKIFPPVRERINLSGDMWVGRLDSAIAKAVMDTCEPQTLGITSPVRQFAQLYSFVRELPYCDMYRFDSENLLTSAVAISRLIHPTSTGLAYAARIAYEADRVKQIFPAQVSGISKDVFLSPNRTRNWLVETEANILGELIPTISALLPPRIHNAFWHHEYASRTYYLDHRWTLVCTGLEALVHTDRLQNTSQFTRRVPKLASELGVNISEAEASEAYDLRSRLSHGVSFLSTASSHTATSTVQLQLYDRLEDALRLAVLKGMREKDFQAVFADDDQIRKRWPIK